MSISSYVRSSVLLVWDGLGLVGGFDAVVKGRYCIVVGSSMFLWAVLRFEVLGLCSVLRWLCCLMSGRQLGGSSQGGL